MTPANSTWLSCVTDPNPLQCYMDKVQEGADVCLSANDDLNARINNIMAASLTTFVYLPSSAH